jgi:hypothetical protein
MQHVVLAYADQMRVEHYFRVENGWEMTVLPMPEGILELDTVEFGMDLEAIYFDVPFEKAPRSRTTSGGFNPKVRPANRAAANARQWSSSTKL